MNGIRAAEGGCEAAPQANPSSCFCSGIGSGEGIGASVCLWHGDGCAIPLPFPLPSFCHLAAAPFRPASALACVMAFALTSSSCARFWTQHPSSNVKNSAKAGFSLRHSAGVALAIAARRPSSAGSGPPRRQYAMSSSRYAPCWSRVRWVVSARYLPMCSGIQSSGLRVMRPPAW